MGFIVTGRDGESILIVRSRSSSNGNPVSSAVHCLQLRYRGVTAVYLDMFGLERGGSYDLPGVVVVVVGGRCPERFGYAAIRWIDRQLFQFFLVQRRIVHEPAPALHRPDQSALELVRRHFEAVVDEGHCRFDLRDIGFLEAKGRHVGDGVLGRVPLSRRYPGVFVEERQREVFGHGRTVFAGLMRQ
jgi:hypothetical protein